MKMYQISIVLFVIGICTAVPQFETPTTEKTTSSVESEVLDITTITPDENEIFRHEKSLESRKKEGGMEQMAMMMSMCKSVLSTIMMLIQPIFQVKALTISFVGMLINIARFIMQLKSSKSGGGGGQGFGGTGFGGGSFVGGGVGSGGAWGGHDRIGDSLPQTYQPNYITRYTIKH